MKSKVDLNGSLYVPAIANVSTANNSAITLQSIGTLITRNVADTNPALTIDLVNGSATGNIANFNSVGVSRSYVNSLGYFYTPGIRNFTTMGNAEITLPTTGVAISRNIGDGNAALRVEQIHASSTGNLAEFAKSGTTNMRIGSDGRLSTRIGMENYSDSSSAKIEVATTGTIISRNVADANPALKVDLANASATANIAEFKFGGTDKLVITRAGEISTTAACYTGTIASSTGMQNRSSPTYAKVITGDTGTNITRDVADARPALTVDLINTSATGNIAEFLSGGTVKTYISKAGSITTAGSLNGTYLTSTIATGTAPLTVASTTLVTNLNADKIDGADLQTTITDNNAYIPSSGAVVRYTDLYYAPKYAIVAEVGSSRNLGTTDVNRIIFGSGTTTFTIPADTFTTGSQITIMRTGTATITVTAGTGVSLNGTSAGSKTLDTQYKAMTLICLTANA